MLCYSHPVIVYIVYKTSKKSKNDFIKKVNKKTNKQYDDQRVSSDEQHLLQIENMSHTFTYIHIPLALINNHTKKKYIFKQP